MHSPAVHQLVTLPNGQCAVRCTAYGETMHPGLGPRGEAEFIHVGQQNLTERLQHHEAEFVVWDVGLGAGANAIAVLRQSREARCPLRIISFDENTDALTFALHHEQELKCLQGYETIAEKLVKHHNVEFQQRQKVNWLLQLGDFPAFLSGGKVAEYPKPDAILFDPFSPARNPAMWTLRVFKDLFRMIDREKPCLLTTYSRSTMVRVTMLLSGFFVGRGRASGLKEETTVASNHFALLAEPLGRDWLDRVAKSRSAEPLSGNAYAQSPLSAEKWGQLCAHPQFST